MLKIDIGPTQGPELKTLADNIVKHGDTYIRNAISAKPLMLLGCGEGLRSQAAYLSAETGKAIKEGRVMEEALSKKINEVEAEIAAALTDGEDDEAVVEANHLKAMEAENEAKLADQKGKDIRKLVGATQGRISLAKIIKESERVFQHTINTLDGLKESLTTEASPIRREAMQIALDTLIGWIIEQGGELPAEYKSEASPRDTFESRRRQASHPTAEARREPAALTNAEIKTDADDWLQGLQLPKVKPKSKSKKKGNTKGKGTPTKSHTTAAATPNKASASAQEAKSNTPALAQDKTSAAAGKASKETQSHTLTTPAQGKTRVTGGAEGTKGQPTTAAQSKTSRSAGVKEAKTHTPTAPKPSTTAPRQHAQTTNSADTRLKQSFIPGEVVGQVANTEGVHAGHNIKISNASDTKSLVTYSRDIYTGNTKRFDALEEKLQNNPSAGKPLSGSKGKTKIFEMKQDNTPERLYYCHGNGEIEILGKSGKKDQDAVILRIRANLAKTVNN